MVSSAAPTRSRTISALAAIVLLAITASARAAPGDTELISVNDVTGLAAEGCDAAPASLSGDGRYVGFSTINLGPVFGEPQGILQIYVRDRWIRETQRASVTYNGDSPNDHAQRAAISADGRFVAFTSNATNFVPGDTNARGDVFVRDLVARVTERVSVNSSGVQGTGGYAAYDDSASLSADGRYVAFVSNATNLVPGDTNQAFDIFLRDRQSRLTERVSVNSNGGQANGDNRGAAISADGRYVAFQSSAVNLVPADTNAQPDIFVHDRVTGRTARVSVSSSGVQSDGASGTAALSSDGRHVAFSSNASNLQPIDTRYRLQAYVHDRLTGVTERVSVSSEGAPANAGLDQNYQGLAISGDGRFVAFGSVADNLVPRDWNWRADTFVHDRETRQTVRVSVSTSGTQGNAGSLWPFMSGDGRFTGFVSWASNLVPNDPDADRIGATQDVYVHEMGSSNTVAYRFTLYPAAIDFGSQVLHTRITQRFWLRNRSSLPLPLTSIGLRGVDRAMFTVSHRCGTSVAVDSGCGIAVTFSPTSAGTKSAVLRVVAGDGQIRTRPISGTGAVGAMD